MNLPASTGQMTHERRHHHRLRVIFEEASALIAPFFADENRWSNVTLDHLAYRVIRDRYPELSFGEVHILVLASRRVYSRPQQAEASLPHS